MGRLSRDPLRSPLGVLVVLVAPFAFLFMTKLAIALALQSLGVELPMEGHEGPRIAGFFALFAAGTAATVAPVRRWVTRWTDVTTAALVASWYAGSAFVFLSGPRSFRNLLPVLVFTGVAVFVTIWWALRDARAPEPRQRPASRDED